MAANTGLPPRYHFVLNPYPDQRIWSCPICSAKTGQKKVPLLIHIEPQHSLALNYTCRYCRACDLLIAHKADVEHLMFLIYRDRNPDVIGNDYLIMGTVEKGSWAKGQKEKLLFPDMLKDTALFVDVYEDLRHTQPGWYADDEEPPVVEPPKSLEWVSRRRVSPNRARDRKSDHEGR